MLDSILKQKFNIKNLKVYSAKYSKNKKSGTITFLIDDGMTDAVKKQISDYCTLELGDKIVTKFKRSMLDEDVILQVFKSILKEKFITIYELLNLNKIKILISDDVVIELILNSELMVLFEKSNAKRILLDALEENFFSEFEISIKKEELDYDESVILKQEKSILAELEMPESVRYIKILGVQDLIGINASKRAELISEITSPVTGVNLAGKISFYTKRSFKKSIKGEEKIKPYYTFVLSDGTGKINCTYFPSKTNLSKMEKISDDTLVLVYGDVELYNERLSFKPKTISYCESFKIVVPEISYKKSLSFYKTISPSAYSDYVQFNMLDKQKVQVHENLIGKTFVVFDFETTGLNAFNEKIIEIGAVKIVDGVIKETFETFINPEKKIDSRITDITGITYDMVKDAPKIEDVIGDFFKFCEGAILSAYNSDFDMSFLLNAAKQNNYLFTNKVIDAMEIAKHANLHLSNYKLKTVLNAIGIENKNAHRAVHDAIATAKMLIYYAKFLN